jgi:hypothetical protein
MSCRDGRNIALEFCNSLDSGGQRDREADPARGGSKAEPLRFWNHPSHDLDFVSIMVPY